MWDKRPEMSHEMPLSGTSRMRQLSKGQRGSGATGDPSSVSKMQKLEKMIRPAVETGASRELAVNLQ